MKRLLKASKAVEGRNQYDWGHLTWMASRQIGNAEDMSLARVTIHAGEQNPRHCHPNCQEVLLLLSGQLRHSVGDDQFELEPGDALAVPAGVFHHAISIGDGDAQMIVAYSDGDRQFVLEESAT